MARILIVDDEDLVRWTARQILELSGHEVGEANNGRQGVQMCRQMTPDLVITDIIMPEQEGIETITQLRAEWPTLKIIAISGGGRVGNMDFLDIAGQMGADRILAKPFEFDDLMTVVDEVLGSEGAR